MMTLGARHYSTFRISALAARQSVRVVSALVATLFAGLLSAFICFSHVRVPHQPVLVAQAPSSARAYFSFLDSRFESYFSPTTFSESFVLRSNQHLATLTSSELTDPVRSDIEAAPAPPEVLRPFSTQHRRRDLHRIRLHEAQIRSADRLAMRALQVRWPISRRSLRRCWRNSSEGPRRPLLGSPMPRQMMGS